MKSLKQIFCLTLLTVFVMTGSLRAEKVKGVVRSSSSPKAESATCLPASSSNELTVNNVRAYIETGGTMWFKEVAEYEVPRGSGKTSMFCAALWIGGKDSNGQLKLAAVRFRQVGDDYWTGPLKITGASTTQSMCIKFDKHFKITRAEVDQHINAYNTSGYVMPASIANWPAHGDEGYSYYLAPFKDVNDNGVYDPENGDYPYYDINNDLCPWTEDNIARAANHTLPRTPEDVYYYGDDWHNSNGMIYADHVLKGDETLFWIFNDNAGAHTESQGQPIGLEIRGQAFGFSTNDELNNMTFYSYEIINRSTYTLTNTYFSQWVDPDLGYANDDYVGCDVARGLGYCYNGSNVDGSGQSWAYGDQPPAVGVDFFQGPYMDPDGRDNPKFYPDSASEIGYCDKYLFSNYELDQMAINGVNFGDSIVDNERFGMRRFVYHNNNNSVTGDPDVAFEYYNMLQGIWKDNSKMRYGGNAHTSNGGNGPECDFMFPGLTDICNWGTKGVDPNPLQYGNHIDGWTEANVGNAPYDRRFMQSAGPFTLKPGSVNYITVGIPWARASQGGAQASVELLKRADDKCQSLFENCFKTLDGPDAPDVTIRELENQLILYITNNNPNSNNYHETYTEVDPQIPRTLETSKLVETVDSLHTHTETGEDTTIAIHSYETVTEIDSLTHKQRSYVFEGYQIYQLANASVSVTDLGDADKALLIAQCDIQNGVNQLINWIYNDALGTSVATEMVNGSDIGISHSFVITEDKFASGTDKKLVNHKEYYFLVVAYGYNEYKKFSLNAENLDGQQTTYLAGRRNIKTTVGIPHKPVESILNSKYGDVPMITRVEGQGNGGLFLDMTDESRDLILQNNVYNDIQYKNNYGPLNIQVIDPLKVKPYDYTIKFLANSISEDVNDSTMWELNISDEVSDRELIDNGLFTTENGDTVPTRSFMASMPISMTNEQLFLDLGISVSIKNANFKIYQQNLDDFVRDGKGYTYQNVTHFAQPDVIGSVITFSNDIPWITGLVDQEGDYPANWIRSGSQTASNYWECNSVQDGAECDYMKWRAEDFFNLFDVPDEQSGGTKTVRGFMDPNQQFESLVGGTWAPYVLSSPYDGGPKAKFLVKDITESTIQPSPEEFTFKALDAGVPNKAAYNQTLTNLYSVDIVLTPDKSKWTRALVLESGSADLNADYIVTQEFHGNTYQNIRMEPKKCPSVDKDGNPETTSTGFGWFPGYAINVETGERLNIMFAENSEDELNNGNDMIFNPTTVYAFYRDMEADTLMLDEDGKPMAMSESVYNSYRDVYGVAFGEPLNGGRHYVYICGSSGNTANNYYQSSTRKRNFNDSGIITTVSSYPHGGTIGNGMPYYECGPYDKGEWLKAKFATLTETNYSARSRMAKKMQIFNNVMWTSIAVPVQLQEANWLSSDAMIKLRVSRPYMRYSSRWYDDPSQSANASENNGYPMYEFTTKNIAPTKVEYVEEVDALLQDINIVPNPYYGYSNYEHTALENYVRIVNLPTNCKISIYTVNGTLIRTLTHGTDATSFVEWDLKNHANIPIASGVYIIHVNAPGYGERTLKFFCNMRPTDLNGF